MQRNIDGIYMRVNRDGKWQNVCLSDMTKEELDEVLADRDRLWLKGAVRHLALTIQAIGCKFDLVCSEDEGE